MVDETWAAKSQSERSLESNPSVGCSKHVTEGGPHTRDCEGCDVAGSNREHRGPRDAQRNKEIEESARSALRICTPRTRPERDAKKATEEAVKDVAESMHECNQHERVLRSEQQ